MPWLDGGGIGPLPGHHVAQNGLRTGVRCRSGQTFPVALASWGYWFKAQAISPLIPRENLVTAYELAVDYGRYDAG